MNYEELLKVLNEASSDAEKKTAVDAYTAGLVNKNKEVIGKNKELTDKLKNFDGIDIEALKKALSDSKERELLQQGKLEELFNLRLESVKQKYEDAFTKYKAELDEKDARISKLNESVFNENILKEATKHNLHPTALMDAVYRAGLSFKLDDNGKVCAKDGVISKDGKPLQLEQWFENMQEETPHWFQNASGVGGIKTSSNGGLTENPFATKTFNLTKQAELMVSNPELANSLQQQAKSET